MARLGREKLETRSGWILGQEEPKANPARKAALGRTYPFRDERGKVCNRRSPLIDRRRAKVWISMSQPPLIQRRSRPCEQFHPSCDTSSKSAFLICLQPLGSGRGPATARPRI